MDQLPDVRNLQSGVVLSEDDAAVSGRRVFILWTALFPCQWTFADLVALEQCVQECLDLFKFVGVGMLSAHVLCRGVYRSFS